MGHLYQQTLQHLTRAVSDLSEVLVAAKLLG